MKKRTEEEDLDLFLATFKKDRQGTITSTGELKLPPLAEKLSVSTSVFNDLQLAEIHRQIDDSNNLTYTAMTEYVNASKNTPQANLNSTTVNPNASPSVTQPINPYYGQSQQLANMVPCPTPIRSVPYSAYQPNPVMPPVPPVASPVSESAYVQAGSRSSFVAPVPQPTTNSDDSLVKLTAEMQKMLYENFGV